MRGRRLAGPLAVTALLLANPAVAATGAGDCRTLAALADLDAGWPGLSASYRADALVDLGVAGKSDQLTGFTTCEFDGGLAEIQCSWKDLSKSEAEARFDLTKTAFATCIKADFTLTENSYAADGLRVLQTYSARIESHDEDSSDTLGASLELMEFPDGDHWVQIDFKR